MSFIVNQIKARAKNLGFSFVDFTDVKQTPHFNEYLKWLEKDQYGQLEFLNKDYVIESRQNPGKLLKRAMSIIVLGAKYKHCSLDPKIDTIQILLPVPLPGTELRNRLNKQQRIYSTQDIGWEYYDGNFPTFEPDEPMTAQDLQASIIKLMGKFYQFKYMFLVGLHVFLFPSLIFFLYNIKLGWRKWYRLWRNTLTRFGGWIIMKGWTQEFKKGAFIQRLRDAQENLKQAKGRQGEL